MTKSLLHRNANDCISTQSGMKFQSDTTPPAVQSEAECTRKHPEKPKVSDETQSQSPATLSARRENDNLLGHRQVDKDFIPQESPSQISSSTESDPENDKEDLLKDDTSLQWIGKFLCTILILVASVAMFFIITQAASFLSSVRQLSRIEQILLGIPMVIFGSIIVWYFVKIIIQFWKLRVSPQVRINARKMLKERKHLRDLWAKANYCEAMQKISGLLEDKNAYAAEDYMKNLRKLVDSKNQIKALERAREQLIENAEDMPGTPHDWLKDFKRDFQNPLDKIAEKRIWKYSKHAAVMTAISPYPLIDRLIVLQACLAMLKELLEIYALKPSWDKNLMLMAQVILNTYLAGVIDDVVGTGAEKTADDVMTTLANWTEKDLPEWGIPVIGKGVGKVAGMFTQAILIRRLGYAAMKMLQPVSMK